MRSESPLKKALGSVCCRTAPSHMRGAGRPYSSILRCPPPQKKILTPRPPNPPALCPACPIGVSSRPFLCVMQPVIMIILMLLIFVIPIFVFIVVRDAPPSLRTRSSRSGGQGAGGHACPLISNRPPGRSGQVQVRVGSNTVQK